MKSDDIAAVTGDFETGFCIESRVVIADHIVTTSDFRMTPEQAEIVMSYLLGAYDEFKQRAIDKAYSPRMAAYNQHMEKLHAENTFD